jgi:mono/diheme cytochrome c family protein
VTAIAILLVFEEKKEMPNINRLGGSITRGEAPAMIKRLIYFSSRPLFLARWSVYYDVLNWLDFFAINIPNKTLPVPADSIPVEGAVYTLGMGVAVNPVSSDDVSIQRGAELYKINCVPCHGKVGKGDGVVGTFFKFKPADLTSFDVQQISDEAIFLVITNGVTGRMPPLNENFSVRERWDLVNFIRTLPNPSSSP